MGADMEKQVLNGKEAVQCLSVLWIVCEIHLFKIAEKES